MTGRRVWRLAEWAGRVLLLGAVAFWWGGYVASQLLGLAFPSPSPNALQVSLNASNEMTVANMFSAATLLVVALLAFGNVVVSRRRRSGWITVSGWTVLTATTAVVALEEVVEFKRVGLVPTVDALGYPSLWPLLVSPLIVAFLLTIGVFVHKGLPSTSSGREVRALLLLGLAAWVFSLMHETIEPYLFAGRARALEYVLEETLEFSGTLLIGLSAALSLREAATANYVSGRQWRASLFGSMAVVAVFGILVGIFAFRVPLVDARASTTRVDTFGLRLRNQEAVVQELLMPATPVQSLTLLLANCDPGGRSGIVGVRVVKLGTETPVLAEGSVEVPVGDCPRWKDVDLLPPLTEPEGQRLAVWVIANNEPASELQVGATKGSRYADGMFWINGAPAWPDQNLEFVAYGAPEPTWSKLRAVWRAFSTDWRWPTLIVDIAIALTFITFIPALLVTAALPRRGQPALESLTNSS